jgi:hypothetical protein
MRKSLRGNFGLTSSEGVVPIAGTYFPQRRFAPNSGPRQKRLCYFLAGIAILETVIESPFMSPVNVTPAWPACIWSNGLSWFAIL